MARPKFTPTNEQRRLVKSMAAMGIQHEQIAALITRCTAKTLRKHFREELDRGAIEANYQVGQALHKKAMSGNVRAQIFWLTTRAGWREKPPFEPSPAAPAAFVVAVSKTEPSGAPLP